jgi:hypothetical protein
MPLKTTFPLRSDFYWNKNDLSLAPDLLDIRELREVFESLLRLLLSSLIVFCETYDTPDSGLILDD